MAGPRPSALPRSGLVQRRINEICRDLEEREFNPISAANALPRLCQQISLKGEVKTTFCVIS
jgi:hypothetical protein